MYSVWKREPGLYLGHEDLPQRLYRQRRTRSWTNRKCTIYHLTLRASSFVRWRNVSSTMRFPIELEAFCFCRSSPKPRTENWRTQSGLFSKNRANPHVVPLAFFTFGSRKHFGRSNTNGFKYFFFPLQGPFPSPNKRHKITHSLVRV